MSALCIGLLVADVMVRPADRYPKPGTTLQVEDLNLYAGGCASNTAGVLAKLGYPAAVAGQVGTDRFGDVVLSDIESFGVDVSAVVRTREWPTSAVVGLIHSSGERSFLSRPGGNEKLANEHIPEASLRKAAFVHVAGAMKLLGLDLGDLLGRAKRFGCTVTLDTDWDALGIWLPTIEPALPHVDYLMTNESEGKMLTGEEAPDAIGRKLLTYGPKLVAIKLGARGSMAVTADAAEEFPGFSVDVLDTTCAGDAFAGGFVFGLAQGWQVPSVMTFANAVGALCTTGLSHYAVASLEGVMALLRERLGEDKTRERFPTRLQA
jgi:ribokinase